MTIETETAHRAGGGKEGRKTETVEVVVDGHRVKVEAGEYIVSRFKATVGVPPQKELDQIVHGTLTALDDNASITIVGHEKFVSHERTGGSS